MSDPVAVVSGSAGDINVSVPSGASGPVPPAVERPTHVANIIEHLAKKAKTAASTPEQIVELAKLPAPGQPWNDFIGDFQCSRCLYVQQREHIEDNNFMCSRSGGGLRNQVLPRL